MSSYGLDGAEATHEFGRRLGEFAKPGLVLAAYGDLGAGKTTLAQGIAAGLGVPDDHYVNSPTFAILQIHPGRMPFYHMDLYRLGDLDEAYGIGLDEVIGTDGVTFIEWPSRIPELLPPDHVKIKLSYEGSMRRVELASCGPESAYFLRECALSNT